MTVPDEAIEAAAKAARCVRTVIPAEAVWRAGCLECDWRYYTLTESRAVNWAEAHSEEEGHGVKVVVLEGGKND